MFSAFILAVLPYFIMQCRFGLDCNLLVNMLTISLCFLCVSLENRKIWLFLLTGILYGVTYYTYALSYIPNTFLLFFITIYLLVKDKSLFGKLLCVWIPAGIVAFPLVMMILVNQFDLSQIEIGMITITKIPEYRRGEFVFELPTVLKNLGAVLSCILTKDGLDYNAFTRYYTMYRVSIPFIILGFYDVTRYVVKNLKKENSDIDYSLFLWAAFILYFVLSCCLGGGGVCINKVNAIFFPQFFLLIWGIRKTYDWIAKKYIKYAKMFLGMLSIVYLCDFASFAHYYFTDYAADIYPQDFFADTYEDILKHLQENQLDERQIYVVESNNCYIYYMLSAKCDPYEVNLPECEYGTPYIGNFNFYVPEQIEESAVYIIRKNNTDYIELVKENGMDLQYGEGMYQCYYKNP